jgi:RHS repeat-associated protein
MLRRMTAGAVHREFLYTADDQRLGTISDGSTTWQWTVRGQGGEVLREFDGATWTRDYVYRGAALLASEASAGTWHYHLDHLGTPRLITDASGKKIGFHTYLPFGAELDNGVNETPSNAHQFTGHERDSLNDLHTLDYMHARFYSAGMGRFLSVDPEVGIQRRPQSWNRYAYALNNPLVYTDPDGRYETNCATDDKNCIADANAFEAARQHDLKSGDSAVHDAAAAYGDPGVVNGIKVDFARLQGDDGKTVPELQGNADGTMGMIATVTIQSGLRGTAMDAVVAHEGVHVMNAQGFAASFTANGASWDLSKNLTAFQTEMNAFRVTHSIYATAQQKYKKDCDACTLGVGVTPHDVDLHIKRILADPKGTYKLTPQNQGNRQFPEWTQPPPQ